MNITLPSLPAGWSRTRVDRVATVNARIGWKALTAAEYQSDGYAFLSTPNIKGRDIDFSNVNYISEFRYEESPELRLKPGDVLLAKDGNTLGIVNIVRNLPRPATVNGSIAVIRPTGINPSYLRHVLASRVTQETINMLKGGMGVPHLFQWDINRLPIPLPPEEEQHRIADFLDAETGRVERMISLQHRIARLLEEREAAQLDIAIDEQSARSGVLPLRRFLWGVDQGTSPQCDAVPAGEDEWGVLKVSCLRPGEFLAHENKRLPTSEPPIRRSEVHEGDLLITRANTPQLVGSTAVVPKVRGKLLLPDKIFRVRLRNGLDPEYVATVARGTRIRSLCSATANGASQSMANIRFDEVKAWPIPVADLSEQRDFAEKIACSREQVNALRSTITRQIDLLAERRQALITAAVTGQIDVSTASGRGIEE
ncbi:restriction endonuclease subunit S [Streptomyces sp. AM8-1-1]|uniref:restriction endonuclease subunit S n=1 Tax=Streptomyces sp. AM8-1-1 TaxID=3075825 RepID=UPI0028C3FBB7|nr:restriction endonuclease subunit S [Streptomyces sp. AM8-1-1]WNO74894.1 restriction endonuclease subunit S [Streptomyces sp. AM8-1-1]